jgi:hypothetical protein
LKKNATKLAIAFALILSVTGCRLQIEVPPGGHVEDARGQIICEQKQICRIEIVDLFFDETYTAVAKPGFTFHGWKKRHRGLGEKEPSVRISTANFEGHDDLIQLLESDIEYYLEPDFAKNHHLD